RGGSVDDGFGRSRGGVSYENYFVGSFLTSSVIHFQSIRSTLVNVWHPIGGISISNLSEGRYLFRLYHAVDAIESRRGGLQKFNFHLLLMHQLKVGKDPMVVPLVTMDFWVLVYDLPHGFMSEMVAMQLARVSTLFRFSRRSKILSLGGIFLYGFRQSERQCNLVFGYERMQGRRGWLKGWLALEGSYWDKYIRREMRSWAMFGLICRPVRRWSQAMLSRPDGRHGNLILECLSFGEPLDCLSPLA
ncbi:hypothetical protein Goari_017937, partial [Gossypium aridum]|nr:hypothetical protein [Gossypium aridum]